MRASPLLPSRSQFDVRGDVKIFDFGLAKELDPKKMLDDGTYNLTADTGSLRYMAPGKYWRWTNKSSFVVSAMVSVE